MMSDAPPLKSKKLVIVGDSAFAEIACEYFAQDTEYDVVAFAVERAYLKRETLLGRPIVALEDIAQQFSPQAHEVFVAVVYSQLNRLRARLLSAVKQAGYVAASYVSPHAFVWPNVQAGEHCFIFEHNVVQPFVTLGDNVILWSGNHIGHHSHIGDNVFVSSHVVVSGFCTVGANSFLGVNAAIANNVTIGKDCWIGPGAVVTKNANDGEIHRARESEVAKVSAPRFFKVKD
jgi:sugar O-acyltransferase (sialic acid O-acetyltransferase NeuD family)